MRYYGAHYRRRSVVMPELNAISYTDEQTYPSSATAIFTLDNTGVASGTNESNYNWLTGGTPGNYEVRATLTSGTFTSGTAGSWLALSSSRSWYVTRSTVGSKTATATFEIREIANPGVILATASIAVQSIVSP